VSCPAPYLALRYIVASRTRGIITSRPTPAMWIGLVDRTGPGNKRIVRSCIDHPLPKALASASNPAHAWNMPLHRAELHAGRPVSTDHQRDEHSDMIDPADLLAASSFTTSLEKGDAVANCHGHRSLVPARSVTKDSICGWCWTVICFYKLIFYCTTAAPR
jgi:hypothetical protein